MTQARMDELKNALENAGWEYQGNNKTLYLVEEEQVEWHFFNERSGKSIILIFYLFDPLGRRTKKLADIHYVVEVNSKNELYFEKINSEEWRTNLNKFVKNLFN